jgi:outer membrane immunogenic protein
MRILVVSAAALTAAGLNAALVHAGDLPYPPPPAYPPAVPYTVPQPLNAFSWAGPYLGGNLGYEWGSVSNNQTKPSGFEGGVQGGYNWQSGCWVFGIEGDLQVTGADDTFAPWKFSNPWFGTIRGRGGYTFNNVLFYGTAGLAFGELRGETFGLSESQTTAGWAVGFGSEVGLDSRWSAKIEYLYISLSESRFSITGMSNGYNASVVRAGVNYHF